MRRLPSPSTLILLATNLIPLAGVLFWGWDIFLLLILYWFETAIIGFWMAVRSLREPPDGKGRAAVGLAILFFTFHAGMFMTVHMIFLWALFAGAWRLRIHNAEDAVRQIIIGSGLWLPLLAMFVGRGVTTLLDLRRLQAWFAGEVATGAPPQETARRDSGIHAFYARIVTMHLSILAGAFLVQRLGSIAPLIILIALKTAIDLGFDFFSRRRQGA
ncbi:MAG: DUF6498-containing protein [Pseudorhodoplanes sp.]|nr:DUF6498-containing protein [Pseudorhodoplanes sp.]